MALIALVFAALGTAIGSPPGHAGLSADHELPGDAHLLSFGRALPARTACPKSWSLAHRTRSAVVWDRWDAGRAARESRTSAVSLTHWCWRLRCRAVRPRSLALLEDRDLEVRIHGKRLHRDQFGKIAPNLGLLQCRQCSMPQVSRAWRSSSPGSLQNRFQRAPSPRRASGCFSFFLSYFDRRIECRLDTTGGRPLYDCER